MRLKHGHIHLELHELRGGEGTPLLLLHALRGSCADWHSPPQWRGPVHALDFCGHGHSDWIAGGGYYPEMLAADADTALAHLGSAAVAGAGLGAYVALMLAGARPAQVPAVVLLPGAGLEGAGSFPDYEAPFPDVIEIATRPAARSDPFVELLEHFVRPEDYAGELATAANRILLVENGGRRPPWWLAVRTRANAEALGDAAAAFERLAHAVSA
jgi:pimeloyl-ACP methyl ester carboxylesterase